MTFKTGPQEGFRALGLLGLRAKKGRAPGLQEENFRALGLQITLDEKTDLLMFEN